MHRIRGFADVTEGGTSISREAGNSGGDGTGRQWGPRVSLGGKQTVDKSDSISMNERTRGEVR